MAEQKYKGEITIMDIAFRNFCQSLDTEELKRLAEAIEKYLKPKDGEIKDGDIK